MKLKLDDQGHAVLQDGHPVYIHDDGKESPFDAAATLATIKARNAEAKANRERAEAADYEGRDEELLRQMYDHFDGFGDADGFAELLTGAASAYLYPAAISAYFEQFGEARRGNSGKRRSR